MFLKRTIGLLVCFAAIAGLIGGCANDESDTPDISPPVVETAPVTDPEETAPPLPTEKVNVWPDIDAETLDGETVTTEDFSENNLTIFNVWATWCGPCISELPHLQEISEYYKDHGVMLVGVMQDGVDANLKREERTIEIGKAFLENAGADYMMLLPDETLTLEFINKMQYFPTTFFLDEYGEVVEIAIGASDTEGWKEIIDEVLEKLS